MKGKTTRQTAPQRLDTSQYRNFFEHTADGITIVNLDGKVIEVNDKLLEMHGLVSRDAVIGKHIREIVSSEISINWEKDIREIIKRGSFGPYERRLPRADGTEFVGELNASLCRDARGNPSCLMFVTRDVTRRKQMENIIGRRLELVEAIARISSRFVGVANIEDAIQTALDGIGRLSGADRAVLVLYNKEVPTQASIYEWRRDAESPTPKMLQNAPVLQWPWWETRLNNGEIIHVKDISELPVEASVEKEAFLRLNYHSSLALPLRIEGQPAGFLSFHNVINTMEWGPDELSIIRVAAVIIGTAFERQYAATLYRTLANSSPTGIYIVQRGKFVFVNPEFQRVTGYSEAELLGTESLRLVRPEDRQTVVEKAVAMLKGVHQTPYEFSLVTKSGETIWAMETATSIQYNGMRATLGNLMDITARKRMAETLAVKNTLLEAATETTIDGILAVNENFRIILTNQRLQEIFRMPQKLIDAGDFTPVLEHITAQLKYPATFRQKVKELIDNPKLQQHYELETKDGRTIERYSAPLLDENGNHHGRINYYRDITAPKQAILREQELREEVNRASRLASIGEMAAGIAHEINNPLTSVIGFAQLLMNHDVSEDIKHELEVINREAQRVARIVEGMLTFARGGQSGEEPVDINRALNQALELRSYHLKINNIHTITRFAPDLPPVTGNANQLKQVFLNIVLNAEKAIIQTHHHGNLTITTEKIGNAVRISFEDDGPGISPENLDKIFDPFFTTSEVGGGTGLGLSICHGIITAHHGKIYAHSQPGQGATFFIELPTTAAAPAGNADNPAETTRTSGAAGTEPSEPSRTTQILIVDDEPTITALLKKLLSDQETDVATANTASDAVELLAQNDYNLIVMDMKMPLMNGQEMYRHIKKINPAMASRVIFITGDILEPSTKEFFEKNRLRHVAKPIDIGKLTSMVAELLSQQP